jgi:elongation factor 3
MRAIVNGQVDGFPPKDELKTVYVEADIGAEYAENTVLEYVLADPALVGVTEEDIRTTLTSVGFTDTMSNGPVTSLSGGWKMKLALARAMLQHADILLCDEPTNHLDVSNVTWVVDYMCSLKEVTVVVVSHDKGFLDRVCTHVIQCDHLRLRNFKGNMTQFVAACPEAAAYLALKTNSVKFTLPEPCFIKGIKSKGKVLLRMKDVEFTYPNTTRQILHGVGIQVSMSSRIAVIGPNGAGKSTMIKLLTGEMEPSAGTVWKHGEMLMAYVAQHAFHHIEQHLEKTPNEYIRWRYQGGMDKEAIGKQSLKPTPEEQAIMDKEHLIDKVPHRIERLGERRTRRGMFEYEVMWLVKKEGRFVQKTMDEPEFVAREKLLKLGWAKPIQRIDEREAAGANANARVLSEAEVEKHLALLGLEREFATHTRMDALSTSQKVKVVIAAAVWDNPHIIVLDEPTNYLDRDSLGALADAIREFQGGVVMISHNNEFTEALCTEQWAMKDGRLTVYGEVPVENAGEVTLVDLTKEDKMDALGNVTKAKVGKSLSRKEARKKKKGGGDDDDEDDDAW